MKEVAFVEHDQPELCEGLGIDRQQHQAALGRHHRNFAKHDHFTNADVVIDIGENAIILKRVLERPLGLADKSMGRRKKNDALSAQQRGRYLEFCQR